MQNTPNYPDVTWSYIPPAVPIDEQILMKLNEIALTLKGIEQILWNQDGYTDG